MDLEKVEVMEQVIEVSEDMVADSGITQLKYYFTSCTKYFNSVGIKPRFLVFFALILVLVLARTPFREAQKVLTMESSRETLEATFNNSDFYQDLSDDEIEGLVEQSLKATENMYTAPIFILTNVIGTAFGLLMSFIWIFIVLKLSKSTITAKQMLAVTVGATVISAISYLVYAITIGFTGSLTDITSLGIFAIGAPVTSTQFIVLNSINIATIITIVFYYFMGISLLKFSKKKSIIISCVLVFVPIIVVVVPTVVVNMLF